MANNQHTASQRLAKRRPQHSSPIQTAIQAWITHLPSTHPAHISVAKDELVSTAPKRFTIYEPLALLPSGSFTSEPWIATLQNCSEETCNELWSLILRELSRGGKGDVTHLAVTEGIPLHNDGGGSVENVRRSPTGLRMLHGDFGPSSVQNEQPTASDFDKAFWVGTKQNGIHQTWAPRWTMFSRGNIKEKARVLGFGRPAKGEECWAVDLYAGIGYFTFSYAFLGMRVLCWEINPWSVEGLRRGARANKWTVKVIQGDELSLPMSELLKGGEQIIVFLESNEEAVRRITEMQGMDMAHEIRHVNCGFLPTSEPTWKPAWDISRLSKEAWLHLHLNVGVADIDNRRRSIEAEFENWAAEEGLLRRATVLHVEQVKTFAPGVWHCVFDAHITRPR